MLFLLIVFVLTAASFTMLLWIVTMFFQGYYYTEPTSGIAWQAPAAGVVVALVLTFWCMLLVNSTTARPGDLPYDTIFRFSPRVEQFPEPAEKLWAVRKGVKEPVLYKRKKVLTPLQQARFEFFDSADKPWNPTGVQAIIMESDGGKRTFQLAPKAEGKFAEFVDENGWIMVDYGREGGPTGLPSAFRWGRFLANLLLNLLHLLAWFASLWLLLRFTWSHALGFSVVIWLVMTLAILPMLLEQAALASSKPPTVSQLVLPLRENALSQDDHPLERPTNAVHRRHNPGVGVRVLQSASCRC